MDAPKVTQHAQGLCPQTTDTHTQFKGIVLSLLLVVFVSPDTLFFRLAHLGVWDIIFYRDGLVLLGICLFYWLTGRKIPKLLLSMDGSSMVIIGEVASELLFYLALQQTTVANTLVIIGSSPIFAALMSLLFLGEATRLHHWICIGISCLSVVLITLGDLTANGYFVGDLLALLCSMAIAGTLVAIRSCRSEDMTVNLMAAKLICVFIAFPWVDDWYLINGKQLPMIALLMGACATGGMICLATAPRFISAATIAMFLPLEIVLGSILVWWFASEAIVARTLIAGVMMVCVVLFHSWMSLQKGNRQA